MAEWNALDWALMAVLQATGDDEDGSGAKILEPIIEVARHSGRNLILDHDQKAVGLQSDNGRLRILGASALAHPDISRLRILMAILNDSEW